MDRDTLWQQFAALPREARDEVADFIAFLQNKYARSSRVTTRKPLHEEPFVGIWQNRTDISDSTTWVRETRQREWHDE
jgi:hypothetical protein